MDLTLAICMYNAEPFIKDTLLAVINQTKQDFHLLIIDDCSTDRSVECVKQFFQQYPRQCELKCLEMNQGIAYARNYALQVATTRYFMFVDADDLPLLTLVEKEYVCLTADPELMAVSSWSEYIDMKGRKMKGGLFIGETDKEAFKQKAAAGKRIFLPIQTMFERKCALRVGGFVCTGFPSGHPRYQDFCEDLDLWTRMSDLYVENRAIITLPEVLYQYRKGEGLSSNHFNMIIKMNYTKYNVRRRRNGKQDVTFEAYMAALSPKEFKALRNDSKAADALKNGAFYLKERAIGKAMVEILKSIWYQPTYLFQKIKTNYLKR